MQPNVKTSLIYPTRPDEWALGRVGGAALIRLQGLGFSVLVSL